MSGAGTTADRRRIASGSPVEPEIGISRAVRAGRIVVVAGIAPIAPEGGGTAAPGDVHGRTRRCIEIVAGAPEAAGASLGHPIRTRVMLADIGGRWRAAARALGEAFGAVRPACTFVAVEADAVLPPLPAGTGA